MVEAKCEWCGVETKYEFPCRVKRFCSHACSNDWKWTQRAPGERVTLSCARCKRPFVLLASQLRVREKGGNKVRFCSKKCEATARVKPERHLQVSCDFCGKWFERDAHRVRPRNFCSRACRDKARRVEGAKWRDPEQIKAYMAAWANGNKDKRREYQRAYKANNKGKVLAAQRARRARASVETFTDADWQQIKEQWNYTCLCCERREPGIKLEADHVLALARGGQHVGTNIQPLCRNCNARKGTKMIDYRSKTYLMRTDVNKETA